MTKFDPYWISLAVIIFGVLLICMPLVHFISRLYIPSPDIIYIMSMIATIAMKMIGGLLVAAGLLSLTIRVTFTKP